MNCYAYALQMYYSGELVDSPYLPNTKECHKLNPGVLAGESIQEISYDDNTIPDTSAINDYMNIVEEGMMNDAAVCGYNLNRYGEFTVSSQFPTAPLPSDFDESSERVIALITDYAKLSGCLDFHYYLRNGTGTCKKHENCSIWTHKMGEDAVTDRSLGWGTSICDKNLMTLCYDLNEHGHTSGGTPGNLTHYITGTKIRFYTIDKEDDLYNSAFQ